MIRRGILTSRALTSSRLDDFFQYSYLYSVMITNIYFLGGRGKLGSLGGGEARHFGGGNFYPLNTLERTLDGGSLLDRGPN